MDDLMKAEPEPTGPEWFTVEEFAKRYNMGHGGAAIRLNKLHAAGQVERWKGRVTGSSCNCPKLKFRAI